MYAGRVITHGGGDTSAQPMENVTNDKAEYIRQWQKYLDVVATISLNPDHELGRQVLAKVDELKELVVKVADAKWASQEKAE